VRAETARPRPKGWTADVVAKDREYLLTEMRSRRIIGKDEKSWSPSQYTRLLRLREAQALGAFDLLMAKLGTLRGVAAEPTVNGTKRLWLTRTGYDRFVFYLSQDARAYFERKGAEAKYVFQVKSIKGKRLFTDKGKLTQQGIEIYNRIQRKLPVFWKQPDGRVTGTVRPPKELTAPVRRALPPPAKKKLGQRPPTDKEAVAKVGALMRSGYIEISETEVQFLLKSAKMTQEQLAQDSSLQVIPARDKVFYLLSPSDPMMAVQT